MPKYRVLELSFINERLVQPGEEIDFNGDPGSNLEPLCDEGRAAVVAYAEKEKTRVAKMIDQYGPASGQSGIADLGEFVKQLAQANAELVALMKQQAEANAELVAVVKQQAEANAANLTKSAEAPAKSAKAAKAAPAPEAAPEAAPADPAGDLT